MLSILIPTYNYDCTRLVTDLQQQAEQLDINYEIIVADDASTISAYKEKNRKINTISHCRFIELTQNIGRARIRNRLADEAQHEWLLFMDADAEVINENFIADYLTHTDAEVICGGLQHADTLPSSEVSLRYAYEKRADKKRAAHYRNRTPYAHFTPFNFMIRRGLFQSIRFDEHITEYGHEDTLFGIELANHKAEICHIDNPLRHIGLESNELFLEKTRAALRNLSTMEDSMQGYSALLSLYKKIHQVGLDKLLSRCFDQYEERLSSLLCQPRPHLGLFFFYKLAYYCKIKNQ